MFDYAKTTSTYFIWLIYPPCFFPSWLGLLDYTLKAYVHKDIFCFLACLNFALKEMGDLLYVVHDMWLYAFHQLSLSHFIRRPS